MDLKLTSAGPSMDVQMRFAYVTIDGATAGVFETSGLYNAETAHLLSAFCQAIEQDTAHRLSVGSTSRAVFPDTPTAWEGEMGSEGSSDEEIKF